MKTRSIETCSSGIAGLKPHVIERALDMTPPVGVADVATGSGTTPSIGEESSGLVPHVTIGARRRGVERQARDRTLASGIGWQRRPIGQRLVPIGAVRRISSAGEKLIGGVVGRDHADAGAGLDRHVADRQPAFHRHGADGGAGIFHRIAGRAADPDVADDRQDHVLRGHRFGQLRRRSSCASSSAFSARPSGWRRRGAS